MKYTATTLMSLLLLGVCSARILEMSRIPNQNDYKKLDVEYSQMDDSMVQKEGDYYSKTVNGYLREDGEKRAADRMGQLKETVYQRLRNIYQQLSGNANAHVTYFDDFPALADPITVGSVVDKFALVTVDYHNVKFHGLNSAHQGGITVDVNSHVATLTMTVKDAFIDGQYQVTDLLRKASGDFRIKLSGDITYTGTFPYQVENDNVQIQQSSGKLHYGNSDSHYENIGTFAQLFQGALGRILLQTVNEKVHDEVYAQFHSRVQQYIQEIVQNHHHESVEKALQEGINNTIYGIQQILSKSGVTSIDLTSNDKEMVYNKLRARITSVKLYGLEKLYLASNHVSYENEKLRAKVQFAIKKPTATAVLSIHDTRDENAPFQRINVDFDMEQFLAELSLDRPSRQSGVEVRAIQAYANRVEPLGTERFEGEVSALVKEKLASHVKHYIEEGMKNFMQDEISVIFAQGVMPPQQQKRFAWL